LATITEIISRIDTRIYELLSDVANITSYSLGGKSVSKTEALNALRMLRQQYQQFDLDTPYESIQIKGSFSGANLSFTIMRDPSRTDSLRSLPGLS
jgi:hypothetical protein